MPLPVNRQSFLHKVAVIAGAVLLWNSCAWSSSTQDRDIQKEIKDNSEATVHLNTQNRKGEG